MIEKDLDNKIKQLVDSYTEMPDSDIWSGIESGLNRRRSTIILRRVLYYSAAAVVIIGLILFVPDYGKKEKGVIISEKTDPVVEEVPRSIKIEDLKVVEPHDIFNTGTPEKKEKPQRKILAEGKDIIFEEENDIEVIKVVTEEKEIGEKTEKEVEKERAAEVSDKPAERTIYDQTYDYRNLYADDAPARKGRKISLDISSNYIQNTGEGYGMNILPPKPLPGDSPDTGAPILPSSDPTHSIPLKFGIGIQYRINNFLSVGTGVNLSLLNSQYESMIGSQKYDVKQNIKYIGIPLNIYLDFVNNNSLRFYGNIGGAMEKALGITYKYSRNEIDESRHDPVSGVQWSARAGLGLEYRFNKFLGIYLDPSVAYYFESNQQVGSYPIRTIRSDRPFQFEFELGLRFSF